ncbi:MAG: hypothetical protein LAN70_17175 [Acidobacteriia bacterium]|nr:hypothetical protein [Terriglobia bacterium]
MTQLNGDLNRRLKSWPELAPDTLAMQRIALRMNHQLAAWRAASAESLGEPQFRLLLTAGAALAVLVYLAWAYISDFLAENPWCEFALLCVVVFSLIAPLILLPLLRAGNGEAILSQPQEGHSS